MNTTNSSTAHILELAFHSWSAMASIRENRQRNKRFAFGRQWDDLTVTPRGDTTTEGALARSIGRHPLTNNMIRQLIKSIIGNFRNAIRTDDPASTHSVPAEVSDRNALTELDCRMLEEFLISGCAIQRIVNERRPGGAGIWVDNVDPRTFFVNPHTDPRGLDIELIGMIHTMSLRELLMRFAPDSPQRRQEILRRITTGPVTSFSSPGASAFFGSTDSRCRVIEVWTLESRNVIKCHDPLHASAWLSQPHRADKIEAINSARADSGLPGIDTQHSTTLRWHCRFLTPSGYILDEYDSPYPHGSHPFVVKFYPLLDGEVHPLVEDIIDQQKNINRLVTMIDHILSVSAKGALLYPINLKPEGIKWEHIQDRWAAGESIIPYMAKQGLSEPRQLFSAGESPGAYHLLELEMKLFKQISGVSDALQGQFVHSPSSSAALCEAEWRLGMVAVLDLIDSYNAFRLQRNIKITNT